MKMNAKEEQNQIQFDEYNECPVQLGPYTSYIWKNDPRHLGFLLARYKFCAKMLKGKKNVLDIGCGDGFGIPVVAQVVEHIHAIDFEPLLIEDNKKRLNGIPCSFSVVDITSEVPKGIFDAAYSLDVIEHIPCQVENKYFENICSVLKTDGIFIMGTPNVTANAYASEGSQKGHINLKSHQNIRDILSKYFQNVFVFSMNDEIVHTGYEPMSHYLLGMGVGKKNQLL